MKNSIEHFYTEKDYIDTSAYIAFQVIMEMRKKGFDKQYLSEKLNVSTEEVGRIIGGQENITIETICRLKKILSIEIDISNEGLSKFLNP